MFEDQQPNQSPPPTNLPTEPADMFAGVEDAETEAGSVPASPAVPPSPNALDAGVLKPKTLPAAAGVAPAAPVNVETPPPAAVYTMKEPILGKIVMAVIILAVVGSLSYGAYYGYGRFIKKPTVASETPAAPAENIPAAENINAIETGSAETAAGADISAKMNNDKILFGEPVDSDKDGLDDVREQELGANINDPDTDKDNLTDGDEALIWHTNPLNPDTDGDGYLDGVEVSNGYNPNGTGKIFNAPAAASATSSAANQ